MKLEQFCEKASDNTEYVLAYADGLFTVTDDNNCGRVLCEFMPEINLGEWISVKDKLPPYNIDVLTYNPYMAMKMIVDAYYFYYGEDDFEEYTGWRQRNNETERPTHWMLLPEIPKRKEDE